MGILILKLIGFFPSKINCVDFDKYKSNEETYKDFLEIFNQFCDELLIKENADPNDIIHKILKLVEFCILFNPETRLNKIQNSTSFRIL